MFKCKVEGVRGRKVSQGDISESRIKCNLSLSLFSYSLSLSLSPFLFIKATSCGVIERVLNWARAKSQAQISKKQSGSKHSKLRGIAKLDDANEAGGKNSLGCTLIITEGDSAKSLAISGLGVIGRDNYGVFPLRGKLLNVREATHNQVRQCGLEDDMQVGV